ncbi:MAG: phosphoribosylformimino-5-aminoimidazole carboxamide ribotide isomerase [Verrucomicrobiota bacterium]|nr:phosphoribosylformimino-5-aminoimidazole carboxamide ribotide isomerase [Verrucomicrobiota bacterium]
MTQFRPCIDLHEGSVKQIIGSSLTADENSLQTNYESDLPAEFFARRYRDDALTGGHLIQLGTKNEASARAALKAYPHGLQIGGGIDASNSSAWLEAGATHVIVTSWLFDKSGNFLQERLDALVQDTGKERLVIDLSCKSMGEDWVVSMNHWQSQTNLRLEASLLQYLAEYCSEFLVHAADIEGKCSGIDEALVHFLGKHSPLPVTYAGGASAIEDLDLVEQLSNGRVDLTIGSALDLFGGSQVCYADCVQWNQNRLS